MKVRQTHNGDTGKKGIPSYQQRATALSHSSGASGWLKAIPQVFLALAILGPEFVVSWCRMFKEEKYWF